MDSWIEKLFLYSVRIFFLGLYRISGSNPVSGLSGQLPDIRPEPDMNHYPAAPTKYVTILYKR